MSRDKREAIKERIRALKAKTTGNGCTEQEANEALAKVAELMQQYDIAEADVADIEAEVFGAGRKKYGTGEVRRSFHETKWFWGTIAEMMGCEHYTSGLDYVVFGEKEAVQTTFYLIDMLRLTAEGEWTKYLHTQKSEYVHGRTARASWMAGFCTRVTERLEQIIEEREAARARMAAANNQSREVMVLHNAKMLSKWAQFKTTNKLNLKTTRQRVTAADARSFGAGKATGGSVSLGGGPGLKGGAKRLS